MPVNSERPRSVRRASTVLIVSAVAAAAGVADNLLALARVRDVTPGLIRAAAGSDDVDAAHPREWTSEINGIYHVSLIVAVLGVVLLSCCAVAVRRPWQPAH